MTTADRTAADALARHFAYADGGWWDHLNDREQATYRARALDVVQVVGPIYQTLAVSDVPVEQFAAKFMLLDALTPKEPTK